MQNNHILIKISEKINTEINGSKNWWNLVKSLLHSDSGGDRSIPQLQAENDMIQDQRRGEPFTDQCVYESDRYGGGSVMVSAGIFHDGRTQLKIVQGTLNVVKYRDDIFDPIILPFLQHVKL
jgi:hypothetical protein